MLLYCQLSCCVDTVFPLSALSLWPHSFDSILLSAAKRHFIWAVPGSYALHTRNSNPAGMYSFEKYYLITACFFTDFLEVVVLTGICFTPVTLIFHFCTGVNWQVDRCKYTHSHWCMHAHTHTRTQNVLPLIYGSVSGTLWHRQCSEHPGLSSTKLTVSRTQHPSAARLLSHPTWMKYSWTIFLQWCCEWMIFSRLIMSCW